MGKRENYESQAEKLIMPLMEANNFELVDIEYVKEGGNNYLRAYIDKEGGITINDCEKVSRAFSDLLDEKDFIDEAYIMEVSSPGLGRQLKKDKDYQRSIGKEVDIKLFKALNKQKEFTGVLENFDADNFYIRAEDELITFKRADVAIIKLALDF